MERQGARYRNLGLPALLLLVLFGCTRAHYRHSADDEVYGLIGRGNCDPRWTLQDYSITPKPISRMYDPDNPDRPPMPPDDPTSHQLMECVDGMKGWPCWGRNGYTPYVENPCWQKWLPRDAEGRVMVDRPMAVQLGLVNSREYQLALENLYLSALDVTFQRFRFDVQFFGSNSTFFTADGPDRTTIGGGSSSLLTESNSLQLKKLSATGSQMVADVANSLVWQFAGPDQYAPTPLLVFSWVQPLWRGGGGAVVLENLTEAERSLLANIRQMEHFRHGFYVELIAGRSPGPSPLRGSLRVDSLTPSVVGATGGILALMESQVLIRNQQENVTDLRTSLDQLEAFYDAGRIDNLQVDQARQALYSAQSTLLSLVTGYQDRLDTYKITLGLPPELELQVDDPLLKPFDLIDAETISTQKAISDVLAKLRDPQAVPTPTDYTTALEVVPQKCQTVLSTVQRDMQTLDTAIPTRRAFLQRLATRPELANGEVDPSVANIAGFDRRLVVIREDFAKQSRHLQAMFDEFKRLSAMSGNGLAGGAKGPPPAGREGAAMATRREIIERSAQLADDMSELALTQVRCRVESITLVPVELSPVEAVNIARQNRLDWMNARAALVDSWRQIEVTANALRGDLNVVFGGDISTLNNNPLQFRSTTGRLHAGLQFDPPLTRLAERNLYREALITYQQTRRQYYAYEDRISQSLRETLRTVGRAQLDFELLRAGVNVAVNQVDVMQFRLQKPPKPGETTVLGATTARDLVQALTGLLSSQNSFLIAWSDYEAQRLNLDFDLGTMRLDAQGNWIDPGPVEPDRSAAGADPPRVPAAEEIPVPPPVPLQAP